MRGPTCFLVLSFSLATACAVDAPNSNMGTSESDNSGSESASESGEPTSDTSDPTETGTETETETGTDPGPYDPLCGEWSSTLAQATRLTEIWLDADDLVATGGTALVERTGGAWSEYVDFSLDFHTTTIDEVWGAAGDRWVIARESDFDTVIHRFDGVSLTTHAWFPAADPQSNGMAPRELVGRGPDDVWALATADCACLFQPCGCVDTSALLHWDGQSWSPVATPGQLYDIALTDTGVWTVGRDGLIARYDGQSWMIDDTVGPVTLEHVWALADDELWVGGKEGVLMHQSGGVWTTHMLPEPWLDIIALEGHAADQVWALDDNGGLWAYDGFEWTQLATLEHAGALAVADEGQTLLVAGGELRHVIWQVDTADGTVTTLHERPHMYVQTMIADDVDHMLLSSQFGQASWSFTEGVWAPAYEQLGNGFMALAGPVGDAVGVRYSSYEPQAVWRLGGDATPIPDPVEVGQYNDVIQFEDRFWVGGREQKPWGTFPFVYMLDGDSWIDHSLEPVHEDDSVVRLTAAGGRLFARTSGYYDDRIMYLDGEDWVTLPNPTADRLLEFGDIAATAADRVWATTYVQPEQMQLWMWDGAQWHDAASSWPQLGEQCCWHTFAEASDGRLWMLSAGYAQSEQLAYFDGNDWTIVDTPPQLHGWSELPQIAVGADGLFIYDGVYVWRYAFCPS